LGTDEFSKLWGWMVDKAGEKVDKIDQALSQNIGNITKGADGIADVFDKVKFYKI